MGPTGWRRLAGWQADGRAAGARRILHLFLPGPMPAARRRWSASGQRSCICGRRTRSFAPRRWCPGWRGGRRDPGLGRRRWWQRGRAPIRWPPRSLRELRQAAGRGAARGGAPPVGDAGRGAFRRRSRGPRRAGPRRAHRARRSRARRSRPRPRLDRLRRRCPGATARTPAGCRWCYRSGRIIDRARRRAGAVPGRGAGGPGGRPPAAVARGAAGPAARSAAATDRELRAQAARAAAVGHRRRSAANLDLIRARAALVFAEPRGRAVEIVYHVRTGPLAEAARAAIAQAEAVYGIAHRLVTLPGGRRRTRTGSARRSRPRRRRGCSASGPTCCPARAGWLAAWLARPEAAPAGARRRAARHRRLGGG